MDFDTLLTSAADKAETLSDVVAFVSWPSAPLTDRLVRDALKSIDCDAFIADFLPSSFSKLVQWATYDAIDHDAVVTDGGSVLSSCYTFRKALIRKHFLSRCTRSYITKNPSSPLKRAVPQTWEIELSFSDELDEMWTDELYELGRELDDPSKWWILKPGMSDRGMGIRLFNSKESLQLIFEEFEQGSDDEEDAEQDDTAVSTSQLRHFIIQVSASRSVCNHRANLYKILLQGIPDASAPRRS